jgi:predicted DNA-binding protein
MTPRKTEPTKPMNIRVPPEIRNQLDELCKRYGMNQTQVILMLISKEYAKVEG